ncbi:hypothetical protein [Streptosporangium sp. NPDC000239]|uniref:hypothetical protein n=1 Tax=unclassified Streptosporangium TaxID=2632669 RepID=UPI00331D2E4B
MATSEPVLYLGAVIENGISQWDTMASDLSEALSPVSAELKALNATAPWGNGPEGRAFAAQYLKGDGPNRLVETGAELVGHITDAGTLLRKTIANSRAADARNVEDMTRHAKAVAQGRVTA